MPLFPPLKISLDDVRSKHLSQVYFTPHPADHDYPEVASGEWRVRKTEVVDPESGDSKVCYKATVKFGNKASGSREEIETNLEPGDFGTAAADVKEFGFGIISKTRYDLGDAFTLDKFEQPEADPEWLAEKEFASQEEMQAWTPPEWCEEAGKLPSNREMAVEINELEDTPSQTNPETLVQAIKRKSKSGRVLVTFSGMSSSGKGTAARRLANHFNALYIEADNYHIGATELLARHGEVNHDLEETYDYAALAADIARLASGQTVSIPRYDFVTAERHAETTVLQPPMKRVMIVDGLYAKRVSEHLKELAPGIQTHNVLINTPLYVCVLRRLLREVTCINSAVAEQRETSMTPEETLSYLHKVAIPTYRTYAHHPDLFDHVL